MDVAARTVEHHFDRASLRLDACNVVGKLEGAVVAKGANTPSASPVLAISLHGDK